MDTRRSTAQENKRVKCGEQERNHMEESCKNSLNCNNCKGNHKADSKYCKIWEREKEIINENHQKHHLS